MQEGDVGEAAATSRERVGYAQSTDGASHLLPTGEDRSGRPSDGMNLPSWAQLALTAITRRAQ